ncbi:MAG: LiaF domain-containing protein, partial [Acidimicrobiia bacterium]
AGASALDLPLAGGIGERDYRPATFAVVDDHYELGIGSLELDLRQLEFAGRNEKVRASVGIGELKVWVPDDVRVIVDAGVSVGELVTFGEQEGGTGVDDRVLRAGAEGGGTLRLELEGGIGSVKVLDADDGGPQ